MLSTAQGKTLPTFVSLILNQRSRFKNRQKLVLPSMMRMIVSRGICSAAKKNNYTGLKLKNLIKAIQKRKVEAVVEAEAEAVGDGEAVVLRGKISGYVFFSRTSIFLNRKLVIFTIHLILISLIFFTPIIWRSHISVLHVLLYFITKHTNLSNKFYL